MNAARPSTLPTARRRRASKTLAVVTLAAGIVIAAPMGASAHVTVTPDEAAADAYSVLTFALSHGCEGSPTTSLTIDIPEGVASLAPELEPGWTIERVGADAGIPTQLVYTAGTPLESGIRASFVVQVKFAADTAGETLAFPVEQACVEGSTSWSELAAEGQDPHDLESPAPTVSIGDAAIEGAHADDTATTADAAAGVDSTSSESGSSESGPSESASSSENAADPVARWLAAGALAAGVAALIVAIVGRTRRRA